MPVKISALPASPGLDGTEIVPIVDGGITRRTTVSAIAAVGAIDLSDYEAPVIQLTATGDSNFNITAEDALVLTAHGSDNGNLVILHDGGGDAITITTTGDGAGVVVEATGELGTIDIIASGEDGAISIQADGEEGSIGISASGVDGVVVITAFDVVTIDSLNNGVNITAAADSNVEILSGGGVNITGSNAPVSITGEGLNLTSNGDGNVIQLLANGIGSGINLSGENIQIGLLTDSLGFYGEVAIPQQTGGVAPGEALDSLGLTAGSAPYNAVYVWDNVTDYELTRGRIFIGPNDPAGEGFTLADGDMWEDTTP